MISFCTLSTFRSCIQEISSLSVLFASLWHFSVLLCGYFLHAIILYSVRSMCSDVCPSVCIWCWDFPEVTLAEVDTNPILTDEYMTQWNTCYLNPTDGISTVANQTFMRSYIRVQRCYIREAYFNFWDKIEDWFLSVVLRNKNENLSTQSWASRRESRLNNSREWHLLQDTLVRNEFLQTGCQ